MGKAGSTGSNSWTDETWQAIGRVVADRCQAILRGLSSHDLNDAVQTCMARIHEKRCFYDPSKGSPTTWARTVASREAISIIRRRRPGAAPLTDTHAAPVVRHDDPDDLMEYLTARLSAQEQQLLRLLLTRPDSTARQVRQEMGIRKSVSVARLKASLAARCHGILVEED